MLVRTMVVFSLLFGLGIGGDTGSRQALVGKERDTQDAGKCPALENVTHHREENDEDLNKMIQAPVMYEDLMLICSDMKGNVAVVMFIKQVLEGVHYKFRFLAHGSNKEVRGKGMVGGIGQKIRIGDRTLFDVTKVDYMIKAGKIQLLWSHRMPGGGWIGYFPEAMSVQIAASDRFEEIDLNRFVQKR